MNWYSIREQIRTCTSCPLSAARTQAIPGEGDSFAGIMFIGQAPGEEEDTKGKLYCGPSGRQLDALFEQAGIYREKIYLTNLIKCMLPHSRRASAEEIRACHPHLLKEMEMVQPRIIIPLGFHPTRFVLAHFGLPRPEKKKYQLLFGKAIETKGTTIFPLRDPAVLLFHPEKKTILEENYRKLAGFFET